MKEVLLNFSLKDVLVCLSFLRSCQPKLLEKNILPKSRSMLKFMYLNSQQQANIVIKNDLFQYGFVRTELIAMYSERPKNFKGSRLQEKF